MEHYIRIQNTSFSPIEAREILLNFEPNRDPHFTSRLSDTKAGEAYIYYNTNPACNIDYRVDDFKWRNMGANKQLPINNPVIRKTFYHCKMPDNTICKFFKYKSTRIDLFLIFYAF